MPTLLDESHEMYMKIHRFTLCFPLAVSCNFHDLWIPETYEFLTFPRDFIRRYSLLENTMKFVWKQCELVCGISMKSFHGFSMEYPWIFLELVSWYFIAFSCLNFLAISCDFHCHPPKINANENAMKLLSCCFHTRNLNAIRTWLEWDWSDV